MFLVAEISGARIENPHLLPFLSGMTGRKSLGVLARPLL